MEADRLRSGAGLHLKIPRSAKIAILSSAFFLGVILTSIHVNSDFPIRAISGEESAGTWVSGALLLISGMLSLLVGLKKGLIPWSLYAFAFALLALDERFMFHERLKFHLQFAFPGWARFGAWIYESPVLFAAIGGLFLALGLYRRFERRDGILLAFAVLFGSVSVAIDVSHSGAFWEDLCKLLAESVLAIAMLRHFALSYGVRD